MYLWTFMRIERVLAAMLPAFRQVGMSFENCPVSKTKTKLIGVMASPRLRIVQGR
jgi:hypothetical protein